MSELEDLKKKLEVQRKAARSRQADFLRRKRAEGFKLVQLHLERELIEFIDSQDGSRTDVVSSILRDALENEKNNDDDMDYDVPLAEVHEKRQ